MDSAVSDREVLDEIKALRADLKDYAQQTARHGADIAWIKRITGGLGLVLVGTIQHLLRKVGL